MGSMETMGAVGREDQLYTAALACPTQLNILRVLKRCGELSCAELATLLNERPRLIGRSLEALERSGTIERDETRFRACPVGLLNWLSSLQADTCGRRVA